MRKAKNRLILRLRLREMTIDGMVDDSGPWFMAKKGRRYLGSGHLGACTKIRRHPVGGAFHIMECNSAHLCLEACSRDEIQAIGTTFGIVGEIDFTEPRGEGKRTIFPYVTRSLFESPFWDAMVACAADDLAKARGWGSDDDDRTHMGWRGAMLAEAKRLLSLPMTDDGCRAWGHEIDLADLRTMPAG